jgi:LEA14-like dessication related protein
MAGAMETRAAVLLLWVSLSCGCVERLADFHVSRLLGIRVESIDGGGFYMKVRCELENPNPLDAEVTEIRFCTYLGESLAGWGQMAGPVHAPARSRFKLEVPVRVAYDQLPADLPTRVAGGTVLLRTETDLKAKTRLGTYRMHLVSTDRTKIAEALEVAIQGPFKGRGLKIVSIRLGGLQLRRVRLVARVRARNPFAFPIRIRKGSYRIAINGEHFGDGALSVPITIGATSQVETELEVAATHGAVGKSILAMLGQQPRFKLSGTLWIDPIGGVSRLPLEVEADSSIFGR